MRISSVNNRITLKANVCEAYQDAKAVVTIISDDGIWNTPEVLDKILGERDLKCTVAGTVKNIKPYESEWKRIIKRGNIELVNHSYNHLRIDEGKWRNNYVTLLREIIGAKHYLKKHLNVEPIAYVCPENVITSKGYNVLDYGGYWGVRRGNRGFNSLNPQDNKNPGGWFNLRCMGICDEDISKQIRNEWIDECVEDNKWLIEMWHNVIEEADGGYQSILLKDAQTHLDYISQKNKNNEIWVATFNEAIKYLREKQNTTLSAYILDGKMHIESELILNPGLFDHELTINVLLPKGMKIRDDSVDIWMDRKNEYVARINITPGIDSIYDVFWEE